MKSSMMWWGALTLLLAGLSGCGGDDSSAPPVPPAGGSTAQIIAAAAADPANDSATNSAAPFAVMAQTPVGVGNSSVAVINFTVFSDGKVVQGLTNANVRVAIAKLTPGSNGNPDVWSNYISVKETAAPPNGPNGTPVLTQASQATTDPNTAASLTYNAHGYYTYTFTADIGDSKWTQTIEGRAYSTNDVVFEPTKTHRVAIQLSYKNAAGETVLVNPYIDFTFDANGSLTTPNGQIVQGWSATNGVVNNAGAPSNMSLPVGVTISPTPTTLFFSS